MDIILQHRQWPLLIPFSLCLLKTCINKICNHIHYITDNLEIFLCDDSFIAQKNINFLDCFGPTNVLSFPALSNANGSLIISLDTLHREAYIYNQTVKEYFLRLAIHGLVHLAGYDHGPKMTFCEGEILKLFIENKIL